MSPKYWLDRFQSGRLGQQMVWAFLLKGGFILLSFVAGVLLARLLGPAEYGIYSYVFALIALLSIPAQSGLPQLLLRETSRGMAIGQHPTVKGIWKWSGKFVFVVSLIIASAAFLWIWFGPSKTTTATVATLAWALLLIPLVALGNLRGAALRGLHKIVAGQLPEFLLRPGFFVLFLLGAALIAPGLLTASSAMLLHVLAAALAFGAGAWLLWRNTPQELQTERSEVITGKAWLLSAIPLALIAGMSSIRVDILVLGSLASPEQVGIYRVAFQFSALAALALQAVNIVVAPRFAAMHSRGNLVGLQRLVANSCRLTFLYALLATLGFIVFGKPLLNAIFGVSYIAAYPAAVILFCGQCVSSAFGSVGFLLNMTGNEMKTVRGFGIAMGIGIVLHWVLIPRLGILGAALATALSMSLWNVLLWRSAKRNLNISSYAFVRISRGAI